MDQRPYVDEKLLNHFMIDAFVAVGVPKEDKICRDVSIESDRRGIENQRL